MPPRNRGKYYNYREDAVERALRDVVNGRLSIREAAERYNVPKSTIHDKYKGKYLYEKSGRPNALSAPDEANIVAGLVTAAEWGFPFTPSEVKEVVKAFLDRKGKREKRFRQNRPGNVWVKGFLNRHKDILSKRLSQNIKRQRAGVTTETIREYFQHLQVSLQDVPDENIVNYDETNVTDDPGQEKVLIRRGSKHADRILDHSKSSTSVMFAVSGSGRRLPLYVVYQSQHLHDTWTQNGPPGTFYNRTSSGWFDVHMFNDWFEKVALRYFAPLQGKKVLIGDNLATHLSINIVRKCEENNIQFILLPANATHLCQPLDVAYFRPLKIAWKKTLLDWKKRNRGCVGKDYLPSLLQKTLLSISEKESSNIKAGFRACGIIPLDPRQVLKRLPGGRMNEEDNGPQWCQTFIEHLRATRTSETAPLRQRRKKLAVPPGKAVTATDFLPENEKEKQQTRNQNQEKDDTNHEEKDNMSETDGEIPTCSNNVTEDEEDEIREEPVQEIEIGKFVICKFIYNENTKKETFRKYIARIINIEDDSKLKVTCLRKKNKKNDFFVYPDVEDINIINKDQICEVLNTPKETRGRLEFTNTPEDLY